MLTQPPTKRWEPCTLALWYTSKYNKLFSNKASFLWVMYRDNSIVKMAFNVLSNIAHSVLTTPATRVMNDNHVGGILIHCYYLLPENYWGLALIQPHDVTIVTWTFKLLKWHTFTFKLATDRYQCLIPKGWTTAKRIRTHGRPRNAWPNA